MRPDRVSATDVVELATDVGPAPRHVGAILLLDGGDPAAVAAVVAERLARVPRFGQRLVRPRLARPFWVEAPRDRTARVTVAEAPAGDDTVLVSAGVATVGERLDPDAPLWRVVVHSRDGVAAAVTLTMHHVLADGIGGLAVLAGLADAPATAPPATVPPPTVPPPTVPPPTVPRPPAPRDPAQLASLGGRLRSGVTELFGAGRAPRCSLNAPTGPRRAAHHVHVPLDPVRTAARAAGATVNDALLVAVTTALERTLAERGEHPDALVVSVPVSARRATTGADLGNQVGVMPVRVALAGTPAARLARVAAETRRRKTRSRGASVALLGPFFRLLAAVGIFRWFVERQRLVTTFLTNLRGPERLHLAGVPVRAVVPVGLIAGNVAVAFAALSYAGRLGVTVVSDPEIVPEGAGVAGHVRDALLELSA